MVLDLEGGLLEINEPGRAMMEIADFEPCRRTVGRNGGRSWRGGNSEKPSEMRGRARSAGFRADAARRKGNCATGTFRLARSLERTDCRDDS